jgi:oligopeptide/dipeptide ABC transporter ATP-binding protein
MLEICRGGEIMTTPLLKVENLKMHFPVKSEMGQKKFVKAVDGVSFEIFEGETLGLVGESGCGKSTIGKLIVKLLKATDGKIFFRGKEITHLNNNEFRPLRKQIQMIFQDPYSSLDPRQQIGKVIEEPLIVNNISGDTKKKVISLMADVGLREEFFSRYPHEFSGGQRQRIGVARALALNPSIIVCDEPVSALDVSIQAQILNLMNSLQQKYNLTYLFISHDLRVVKHICNRIAVMYLGRLVELADKKEIFNNPMHPYTKGLLSAIPIINPEIKQEQGRLKGDIPSPINLPKGCRFHTRCESCMEICKEEAPIIKEIKPEHLVECHLYN